MEERYLHLPRKSVPEAENGIPRYSLDRRTFIDIIWNRIEIVEFYSTTLFEGRIYPLPNYTDRFGRVKVALAINPDNPKEKQAQTLVHESIHIDRAAWEKGAGISVWSDEYAMVRVEEDRLTEDATNEFYNANKSLAKKALHHVWLKSLHETR